MLTVASQRRITRHLAIHEAAHAVAAWSMDADGVGYARFGYADLPFYRVALSPAPSDLRSRGHALVRARYVPVGKATRRAIDTVDQLEAWKAGARMEADVIGALAGPVASAKHLRKSAVFVLMTYGHSDLKVAEEKLCDFAETKDERNALLDDLYNRAAIVVGAQWSIINTLADALLVKPCMEAV